MDLVGLPGWTVQRYSTSTDLASVADLGMGSDSFWARPDVLAYLSDHPQGCKTEALYLVHPEGNKSLWVSFQEFIFSAAGNVKPTANGQRSKADLRRRLLSPFKFKVGVIGQLLTSGPFAYATAGNLVSGELTKVISATAEMLLRGDDGYAALLIKDIFPSGSPAATLLRSEGYFELPADPIMEVKIDANWSKMEDYLADITSKYRVRYRRAREKFHGLTRRRLTAHEVDQWRVELFSLYRSTTEGAAYNDVELTIDYLPWLANTNSIEGQGASGFTGYFVGETLIGFTSSVPNGQVLHAHFLGMVGTFKTSHHLYHNMLFDLLEEAIKSGFNTLDYGRTALEIKSSVGATARDYSCLLKASSTVLNRLVPLFTPAVYKRRNWQPRNPFKAR